MKLRRMLYLIIGLSMLVITGCEKKYNGRLYEKANWDLSEVNKLMIVAHPDDDTIWGGAHLLQDKYLVVCVTCGVKEHRVKEFETVMSMSEDPYYMLAHVDNRPENKEIADDWANEKDQIYKDLNEIIKLKNWDEIVTHNPLGEYGHQHHIMTSQLVTEAVQENNGNLDKLVYFARYIKPDDMSDEIRNTLPQISEEIRIKKREMISEYKSQSFIVDAFGHMFRFENWVAANDWGQ